MAWWPGGLLDGGWTRWRVFSAARSREWLEFSERGEKLGRPRPCVLEVEFRAVAGEREPTGDVQQLVANPLGLGFGELAVRGRALGSRREVVREHHELLQPHFVERELLERELGQTGVFVVTDPVLDVRVLPVAALEHRDVLVGLGR